MVIARPPAKKSPLAPSRPVPHRATELVANRVAFSPSVLTKTRAGMSKVTCHCGAVYERTEIVFMARDNDRGKCQVCGEEQCIRRKENELQGSLFRRFHSNFRRVGTLDGRSSTGTSANREH
jgi:hypothetical protein